MEPCKTETKKLELLRKYSSYLFILLAVLFVVYIPLVFSDEIFTVHGTDEQFYYMNSKSVVENRSLRASVTFTGKGAEVYGADAHGFVYPALFGLVGIVFGYSEATIPLTNSIMIVCSILIVMTLVTNLRVIDRALIAAMFVHYPLMNYFYLSHHVEAIQVLITSIVIVWLTRNHDKHLTNTNLIFTMIMLLVFALVRSSWALFSIALIPLAQNKKQQVLTVIGSVLTLSTAFFVYPMFSEKFGQSLVSVYSVFLNIVDGNYQLALKQAAIRFLSIADALSRYSDFQKVGPLAIFGVIYNILLLSMPYILLRKYWKDRDKLALGLAFTSLLLMFSILFISIPSHIIRYSLPMFLIVVAYLVKINAVKDLALVILICSLLSPLNFILTEDYFAEEDTLTEQNYSEKQTMNYVDQAADLIESKSSVVLLHRSSYVVLPLIHRLPVKNTNGKQIRYIVSLYRGEIAKDEITEVFAMKNIGPKELDLGSNGRLGKETTIGPLRLYHVERYQIND